MKLDFLQSWAGLLSLALATVAFGADYVITDLGPGSGVAINNSGAIVRNSGTEAFFHQNGAVTPILVRLESEFFTNDLPLVTAMDLNDGGVVAGMAAANNLGLTGSLFRWTATESLATQNDSERFVVWKINNVGAAVVSTWDFRRVSSHLYGAFPSFWANKSLILSRVGELLSLNDAGVMVGYMSAITNFQTLTPPFPMARAIRIANGVTTYLDPREGTTLTYDIEDPARRLSEAFAINEGGTVVGRMAVPALGPKHAFRYVDGTGMQDLGTLGGAVSEALDVNDSGVIVGHSQVANGQWRAFVYENGSMTDLNSRLPAGVNVVLLRANRINNVGQIVGDMLVNGATHAFVLSPPSLVPAPQIVEQPQSLRLAIGETAVLTVSATGALPIRYQWWKGTEPMADQTNASLTLSNANAFTQETYRVEVSNSGGSVSSSTATVTVLDPELTPYTMAALSIVGEVGGNYRIEFKPDARGQNWQPLATIQLTNNPQWFIDVESTTNRSRIYRSIRQP